MCPTPFVSIASLPIAPKKVSDVPMLMTTVPGSVAPQPIRLLGLSPDDKQMSQSALSEYLSTKYGETLPATLAAGAREGSLSLSSGAQASSKF